MKLTEYIEKLNERKEQYGDLKLIYSKDDEGNGFRNVVYGPSVGKYNGEEFVNIDDIDEEYYIEGKQLYV